MIPNETQLYAIPLPQFIIGFKDTCIKWLIPLVDSSISYIENADNTFLLFVMVVLLVQIYRTIVMRDPLVNRQEKDNTQNRQIAKEIKDLKKELKSIQNMLLQLKSTNFQQQTNTKSTVNLPQTDTNKLINYCKQSWQKREQIASNIMDWQVKIIKQVAKLKNKNRSSRSPSKNQISSSKQFSAQSKKSIKSTIHHIEVHQENKALFQSDIKIKEEQYQSEKPQQNKKQHNHQETIINVKIENQQGSQPKSSTINIELHQTKNQIQIPNSSLQEQVPIKTIEPSLQKQQEQKMDSLANQEKIPVVLPRPPSKVPVPMRRQVKKGVPPPVPVHRR